MQNNLEELWSLLNFLLPSVFDSAEDFQNWCAICTAQNISLMLCWWHVAYGLITKGWAKHMNCQPAHIITVFQRAPG